MTQHQAETPKKFTAVPGRHTGPVSKILIANRGEIAVRVIRAARDEGLQTVAVYADPDRDAQHVKLADEAYALGGATAAQSYLVMDKLIEIARRSGADAVHPGYGFLSENAQFAQKCIDAGLTWIGPSPKSITQLGDKVAARHIAQKVGAPLVPGTKDPVKSADEAVAFADEHGLPIAVKAAFGGGGRGIKVARDRESIVEMYESAVREATAAFGRGECFIERFLDSPRHVETQCLADAHGNVVVVSTRDCSLQRRNQKLVEEAPAPYLSDEQNKRLYEASRAILREAGYQGAGTCEFLVGTDGTISFLEVNTRLQVEHPVSEEISGLDLVREQFRINGEDAGRSFMPAPGTIEKMTVPTGPGVRWDSGFVAGDVIGGNFDSMLAKLIVTGADREQALQRSRRALAELTIEGMPTVIPFHRVVLNDPAFAPAEGGDFKVHTRWIETEFNNTIPMYSGAPGSVGSDEDERTTVVVEVNGKRMEVSLPDLSGNAKPAAKSASKTRKSRSARGAAKGGGDELTSPMQGTIVKVAASDGDTVAEGDLILVLEAMKMEQPIIAHKAGKVSGLSAKAGDTVTSGTVLATIK